MTHECHIIQQLKEVKHVTFLQSDNKSSVMSIKKLDYVEKMTVYQTKTDDLLQALLFFIIC